MIAYPLPNTVPVRVPPDPPSDCRICGDPVPSEDFGEYDELGARCNQCIQDEEEG